MTQRVLSRSQRRMERKQAIVLLCLALAISLVSFSLGVMVGRSGNPPQPVATAAPPVPVSTPAVNPAPSPSPAAVSVPEATQVQGGTEGQAPAEVPAAVKQDEKLTFYDTLPRGEQPLGSGINLPPDKAAKTEPAADHAAEAKPAPAATPSAAKAEVPVPKVPAAAKGQFVVQVASFKDAAAANSMLKKLSGKGYVLFVEPADLGAKGVWHRVYAGPYAGREVADRVASQLREREKISPLVRKR